MTLKPDESSYSRQSKSFSSKTCLRSRSKTTQGVRFKDQVESSTNILQSVTLIGSQSTEKNVKPETPVKNTYKIEGKNNHARSKSLSERYKLTTNTEGLKVRDKNVGFPRERISNAHKNISKEEPENKFASKKTKARPRGFTQLLPLCENELKKIEDVWLSTIYCSLSLRANLVKLLFQAFPNVEKAQFNAENRKLVQCLNQAKACTKSETDNLIQLVKSLMLTREKLKEEYIKFTGYEKNQTDLSLKTIQLGEETEQLKTEVRDSQKKKEATDKAETDQSEKTEPEKDSKKKDGFFFSFFSFGSQKENSSEENNSLNTGESKENKSDVVTLLSVQKKYEELKKKYFFENEEYEKKIKELETLLEKKTLILKQEREVKNQLQVFLTQFQEQKKTMNNNIAHEQFEFLMEQSPQSYDIRQQELWLTSIKLILKGFFKQFKKLEMERNKTLFQLQSNNTDNINLAAAIIQKDNFVRSIKEQMKSFNETCQKT